MAWITEAQADNFLNPNPEWDTFTNKGELLKLATNRLEQLTFRDESIDRVGARYIDGNSVSKVAGSDDFLLEANKGNWAYHAALGWTRTVDTMDLHIYDANGDIANTFGVLDIGGNYYTFEQQLTLRQIQSLQTFGGTFGGEIALDATEGSLGAWSNIETRQANAIVDKNGDQVFLTYADRRISILFRHDDVHVWLYAISGLENITFNGITTIDVIDEQGEPQTNTVPEIFAGDIFTYKVKIVDGLDKTMFFYVNDILVGNPTFARNTGAKDGNRLLYTSGSQGGSRKTYVKLFGSVINTENPITIPIRLVGACALLAFEYGKFPPNYVGDKEYIENETDYNTAQDLPINVQAAVEPFLGEYIVPVILDDRGEVPEKQPIAIPLGYVGEE